VREVFNGGTTTSGVVAGGDMTVFSRAGLATAGFACFVRVADLQTSTASVPRGPGVYVVVAPSAGQARFLTASIGGRFKGKDPSVPVSVLSSRWHATTDVLYIGKATSLRSRVGQLVRFGGGSPVGHWGGRYLWQVAGSAEFLVAWRAAADPRADEVDLLAEFVEQYGALPYANIAG
jgi:hypothetical protein